MKFYWLIISILAVWRITNLFNAEDGPWDLFYRIRKLAGKGIFGNLLDCFLCLSLWVSLPFAFYLGDSWIEKVILLPAFSAGAILLERFSASRSNIFKTDYSEDDEEKIKKY